MKHLKIALVLIAFSSCSSSPKETKPTLTAPAPQLQKGILVSSVTPLVKNPSKKREAAALSALKSLLKNYADGNTSAVEAQLDNSMVGYANLIEQIRQSTNAQKQIEFSLQEPRYTKGKGVYILNFDWQKRFNELPNLTSKLVSGKSTFMFQRLNKTWKLSSLSGDNPFAL